MQVDYIKEPEIESIANEILKQYPVISNGFVDIEELLENHLGICLDFFDVGLLPAQKQDNVLGYIDFMSNIVAVHDSLFESENIGRFNFTLAHEIGHYVLHKDAFMANINHPNCLDLRKEYLMTKQKGLKSKKPVVEWQADCFASCLLMPKKLVIEHWFNFSGGYGTITYNEIAEHFAPHVQAEYSKDALAQMHIKEMAQNMNVSAQALCYRLQNMNLITEHKQYSLI